MPDLQRTKSVIKAYSSHPLILGVFECLCYVMCAKHWEYKESKIGMYPALDGAQSIREHIKQVNTV